MMENISTDTLTSIYHVDVDWKTPFQTDVTPTDILRALKFSKLTGIKENARYALTMGIIAMLSGLTGIVGITESVVFHSPEPLWLAAAAFGLAASTGYMAVGVGHVADQQYRKEENLALTPPS